MTLKNKNGQALVEGLCVLIMATPLFVLLVLTLLQAITTVAADHFLDVHLICMAEGHFNCISDTQQKLRNIGWKNITLSESNQKPKYTVTLRGKTNFGYDISKERELQLDLEVH